MSGHVLENAHSLSRMSPVMLPANVFILRRLSTTKKDAKLHDSAPILLTSTVPARADLVDRRTISTTSQGN
jgi:hypothetical protein